MLDKDFSRFSERSLDRLFARRDAIVESSSPDGFSKGQEDVGACIALVGLVSLELAHPRVECVVGAEAGPSLPMSVLVNRLAANGSFRRMDKQLEAVLAGISSRCQDPSCGGKGNW